VRPRGQKEASLQDSLRKEKSQSEGGGDAMVRNAPAKDQLCVQLIKPMKLIE
jgi:hypothetical protein